MAMQGQATARTSRGIAAVVGSSPRASRTRASAGLAALLALGVASCGDDVEPRGAILITIDTARADALTPYGAPGYVTPYLERISGECVRYTNAFSVAPLTLPTHASMLTGLYPPRHGLRDNGLAPLPESAVSIAERARAAGMATGAFVSSAVLDRAFALDQGFEVYDSPPRDATADARRVLERSAPATIASARAWLADLAPDRRFFLWLHLYDAHLPYAPPPEFLKRTQGDAYLGELAAVDAALGDWLESLRADGRLARSFVAITSDHGESRGEHREPTHGALCYDATLRVPLLLRYPDGRRGGSVEGALTSSVDLAPTLIDALGLPPLANIDGQSLFDAQPDATRGLYCESYSGFLNYGWSPLSGWITPEGKYLHSSRPECYLRARDPKELHDGFPEPREMVERARAGIDAVARAPALIDATRPRELSAIWLSDLRRLGYGAGGPTLEGLPHPLDAGKPGDADLRPAPADRAGELEPLLLAHGLLDAGDPRGAVEMLAKILRDNPRHRLALDMRGFALLRLDRAEEARESLLARVELGGARVDTWINLAAASELTGRAAQAAEQLERALALDPTCRPALAALERLATAIGDEELRASAQRRLAALDVDAPGESR